jgi:hypothetical protein
MILGTCHQRSPRQPLRNSQGVQTFRRGGFSGSADRSRAATRLRRVSTRCLDDALPNSLSPARATAFRNYRSRVRARHSASKLSESGARAFESKGSFGFSLRTLPGSSLEADRACACTGHSNDDFESMGLPSYQHFRPSMRRQDQYACEFDGIAALHCCFACAVGSPSDENVAMQATKAIGGM